VVSYPQALAAVRQALQPSWEDGTFWLDDALIVEDGELYYFRVGPREWLVDGDVARARFGGAVAAVVKSSGQVIWVPEVRLALRHRELRYRANPDPAAPA
jgi:hypothetical protein